MDNLKKNIILSPFNLLYKVNPKLNLKILFFLKHRKRLNLDNPVTYSEKLQWIKLYDKNPLMPICSDKYTVRKFVADQGCAEILNELYWEGEDPKKIPFRELPEKFVIKVTHGSTFNIICTDKSKLNTNHTIKQCNKWLKAKFLPCYGEWFYGVKKPRVIVEKYIESDDGKQLKDFKVFCFNGEPEYIRVDTGRFSELKQDFYDCEWNHLPDKKMAFPGLGDVSKKPVCLEEMLEYSRLLSGPFLHARVDFYISDEKIYFGEITFTTAAGFNRFRSHEFNVEMGEKLDLFQKENRIKVLNVVTGGIFREGITTTQLAMVRKMELTDLKMDFVAVSESVSDVIQEIRNTGCNVIHLPSRKRKVVSYAVQFYKLLKKEQYDIVHVHGSSGLMAVELYLAKRAGVKVRIAHSRNTRCKHERLDRLVRPFFNKLYTDAFACGTDAGKYLFGKRDFTVIHNGKDISLYRFNKEAREKVRTKYGLEEKLAIGFVGTLNQQKNVFFLIDALKEIVKEREDAVLFIVGAGKLGDELEDKVKHHMLSDHVVFTGRVKNTSEILQGMDVMLLPSLYEGLPNVVIEWQIAGLYSLISDQVTKECKLTELVEFLPINQGAKLWKERVLALDLSYDREKASFDACKIMKEAGYNIDENAKFVKGLYLKMVKS